MNRIRCLILPMAIALASACDHDSAYVATPHVATWEFMQSVGGIAIGQPEKIDDSAWVLPIRCDVSGLTTVTREPKVMHSGVVVTRMLHEIRDGDIAISIVINTPMGTARSSACPSITLKKVAPGDYRVLYMEPNKATHALGTVIFN
jgi:hypothetical protein